MKPPVPVGEGLVVRRVRLSERDVVVLGGILHGEDHFASIHGEHGPVDEHGRVIVSVLTTAALAGALDACLAEVAESLALEVLSDESS